MARKAREGLVDAVALGVARGQSLAASARANKVPERTARTWGAEASFKTRVATLRASIIDKCVGRLARISTKAVTTLEKLLDCTDKNIQLKAAQAIITNLIDIREHGELYDRLEAIEKGGNHRTQTTF